MEPVIRSRAEALHILGLPAGAGKEEIHEAYRQLMKRLHPDTNATDVPDSMYFAVQAAYEYLLTHEETQVYSGAPGADVLHPSQQAGRADASGGGTFHPSGQTGRMDASGGGNFHPSMQAAGGDRDGGPGEIRAPRIFGSAAGTADNARRRQENARIEKIDSEADARRRDRLKALVEEDQRRREEAEKQAAEARAREAVAERAARTVRAIIAAERIRKYLDGSDADPPRQS